MSSPRHSMSIEIAASWPWATAQMMFFGPNAASPPKNTLGSVDCIVTLSTTGMPHLSNSMPMSRSIHGKAFSWPIGDQHVVAGEDARRARRWAPAGGGPSRRTAAFTFSNITPVSLPLSCVNALGTRKLWIGMPSCMRVFLFPRRRLHFLEAASARRPSRLRRPGASMNGSSPSRCCRRPARSRACRSCRCGRTTRWTASRCRCGCSPPPPCGRGCRGRGRAARRCRRIPRRSSPPAAPSGCRRAGRRGTRRRCSRM